MADEQGRGRPSLYRPEFCEQARELCEGGATDADLARAFDVCRTVIFDWRAAHPEFRLACKLGKEAADDRVEASLYERAVGYGDAPPDTTAAIFWLKNRRSDRWRDRSQHELSGPEGGPIVVKTDKDRAKALASLISKVKEKKDA